MLDRSTRRITGIVPAFEGSNQRGAAQVGKVCALLSVH
jgi:hypothetical protein